LTNIDKSGFIVNTVKKPRSKKERIWLYIDEKTLEWVYERIETKEYADLSHCFERLVMEKIQHSEKEVLECRDKINPPAKKGK
jgi:hypothetical protein